MVSRLKKLTAIFTVFALIVTASAVIGKNVDAAQVTEAYMMFSSDGNVFVYWHDDGDYSPIEMTKATVTGPGQYTVGMDFTKLEGGCSNKIMFMDFEVANGEQLFPGYFLRLDKLVINGEETEFEQGYTTSDNEIDTRMNIVNKWAGITDNPSARSYDGKLTSKKVSLIDPEKWPELKTVEVTFTYAKNMPAEAGTEFSSGAFKYKVTENSEVEVTGLTASGKKKAELNIPAAVNRNSVSYKVTSVAANACKNAKAGKLVLGKNLKTIGASAFEGCKKLSSVKCNGVLGSVGKNAFKNTSQLKVSGNSVAANKKIIKDSGAKVK